ncbi:hypothetical protein [Brunnivagina elsteri]|uniref:hypothetical protein n=1 Tax=Brunnivagina elsteri TaxID=1247191 RepID=UPI0013042610|nr:hypothetical protein [Calothrix elsteri]
MDLEISTDGVNFIKVGAISLIKQEGAIQIIQLGYRLEEVTNSHILFIWGIFTGIR